MLIPKASHLVERAAERLLRSGALDDTAAQLMQPGGHAGSEPGDAPPAEPDPVPPETAVADAAGPGGPKPASVLFAPLPPLVPPLAPPLTPPPLASSGRPQRTASPGPQPAANAGLPSAAPAPLS